MKEMPLRIRGFPQTVRKALKKSAKVNRGSLNRKTMGWQNRTENKVSSCGDAARILQRAYKVMTAKEHREMADDIAAYSKRNRREPFRGS